MESNGEGHLLPPVTRPLPEGSPRPMSRVLPPFDGDPEAIPSDYPEHESVIDRALSARDGQGPPAAGNLAVEQDAALAPHLLRAAHVLSAQVGQSHLEEMADAAYDEVRRCVAKLCQAEASALEQAERLGEENERLTRLLAEAPKRSRRGPDPENQKLRLTVTNFEHQVENLQGRIRALEAANEALRNRRPSEDEFFRFVENLAGIAKTPVLEALVHVLRHAREEGGDMPHHALDLIVAVLREKGL